MSYKPEGASPHDETTDIPGGGTDKRLIARLVVAFVAVVLAILFVVRNNSEVETDFIFFTVTTKLWVGLVVALALGALLGQVLGMSLRRRRRRSAAE